MKKKTIKRVASVFGVLLVVLIVWFLVATWQNVQNGAIPDYESQIYSTADRSYTLLFDTADHAYFKASGQAMRSYSVTIRENVLVLKDSEIELFFIGLKDGRLYEQTHNIYLEKGGDLNVA